jgi:hypothetical protein
MLAAAEMLAESWKVISGGNMRVRIEVTLAQRLEQFAENVKI